MCKKLFNSTIKSDIIILLKEGIVGCGDADFAGCLNTRRSTTGVVFLLHGGAVAWASRVQPTMASSTTEAEYNPFTERDGRKGPPAGNKAREAEYMAGAAATREGLWLRTLSELGMGVGIFVLMCDNQSALKLMNNPVLLARTKHIDVLHHFVRDLVARGDVCVKYCDTGQMVADSLTKQLHENKMQFCSEAMGLRQ
jgi:hypothetical protein